MEKIRSKVFETNSSSCHSLVIDKNTSYTTMNLNDKGNIVIATGQYGWGNSRLTTPEEKAAYLHTLFVMMKMFFSGNPKMSKNFQLCKNNFIEVIREQTHANNVILVEDANCYIDHQSCEDIKDYDIFFSKKDIKNRVFGKSSYINISNDNE